LGTTALLITLGRTAILLWAIYVIVLFGLWLFEKYKKRNFNPLQIFLSVLIIIGIIAILLLQNNLIAQRFLTTNLSDESIVQRQTLMSQSLKMFWQSPIFGVGINNYFNNLNIYLSKENPLLIQPVHNIFLLVLAETGIVGLATFLFVLLKSFLVIIKKQNKYLLLSLLTIICLGMFDHYFLTLQQGQLLFSLVLGISFAKS
jgi:O-antigen ligase